VNFSLSDLSELPFAAALVGARSEVVARTPEWAGAGPGTVAYPVRRNRLLIACDTPPAAAGALLGRLLDAIDAAAAALDGLRALRVRMVAASLRLLAGRAVATTGTSHDVLDLACAGISARTALRVDVEGSPAVPVDAPEAAALLLVQLAVNAERHARVSTVTLRHEVASFHVRWRGHSGKARVETSRQRQYRERWGMGFARIAADALGGAVYPPVDDGAGNVVATLELGLGRLALAVAAVRGGRVLRATRTWDEETGAPPGARIDGDQRLTAAWVAARSADGAIASAAGVASRKGCDVVWIAIPPDAAPERARDIIDGIAHERALMDGIEEPARSRIAALALLLGSQLGTPLPRVPAATWNRRMVELAGHFPLPGPVPTLGGVGATDPGVSALLAAEAGEGFDRDGDELWLRLRDERIDDPLVAPLLTADRRRIRLA
jgi:hypothetical protein